MDYQRPDNQNPRVEDDFVRPLSPMKSVSRRRLPAALPFAIAGILVVSSVAFGATVIRSLVPPSSSATPIVVGDEPTPTLDATPTLEPTPTPTLEPTATPTLEPTPTPTLEPTKAPTPTPKPATPKPATPAPTPNCSIALTAELIAPVTPNSVQPATAGTGYKVKLTWTKYNCGNFQWYGILRANGTATPQPVIGDIPPLYTDNQSTVTSTVDYTGTNMSGNFSSALAYGHTYTFRVLAFTEATVKTVGEVGPACYVTTVLAISNNASVTIPVAPTPIPTPVPTDTPAV